MNDKSKVAIGLHSVAAFIAMGVLLSKYSSYKKLSKLPRATKDIHRIYPVFVAKSVNTLNTVVYYGVKLMGVPKKAKFWNEIGNNLNTFVMICLIFGGGFLFTSFIPDIFKKEKDKKKAWKTVAAVNMLVSFILILPIFFHNIPEDSVRPFLISTFFVNVIFNVLCIAEVLQYKWIPLGNSILFIMMLPLFLFSGGVIKKTLNKTKALPLYELFTNEPIKIAILIMLLLNVTLLIWTESDNKSNKKDHPYTKVKEFIPLIWTVVLTFAFFQLTNKDNETIQNIESNSYRLQGRMPGGGIRTTAAQYRQLSQSPSTIQPSLATRPPF